MELESGVTVVSKAVNMLGNRVKYLLEVFTRYGLPDYLDFCKPSVVKFLYRLYVNDSLDVLETLPNLELVCDDAIKCFYIGLYLDLIAYSPLCAAYYKFAHESNFPHATIYYALYLYRSPISTERTYALEILTDLAKDGETLAIRLIGLHLIKMGDTDKGVSAWYKRMISQGIIDCYVDFGFYKLWKNDIPAAKYYFGLYLNKCDEDDEKIEVEYGMLKTRRVGDELDESLIRPFIESEYKLRMIWEIMSVNRYYDICSYMGVPYTMVCTLDNFYNIMCLWHWEAGNFDVAKKYAIEAIEADHYEGYYFLGYSQLKQGEVEIGMVNLHKAIDYEVIPVFYTLAKYYDGIWDGESAKGASDFDKMIEYGKMGMYIGCEDCMKLVGIRAMNKFFDMERCPNLTEYQNSKKILFRSLGYNHKTNGCYLNVVSMRVMAKTFARLSKEGILDQFDGAAIEEIRQILEAQSVVDATRIVSDPNSEYAKIFQYCVLNSANRDKIIKKKKGTKTKRDHYLQLALHALEMRAEFDGDVKCVTKLIEYYVKTNNNSSSLVDNLLEKYNPPDEDATLLYYVGLDFLKSHNDHVEALKLLRKSNDLHMTKDKTLLCTALASAKEMWKESIEICIEYLEKMEDNEILKVELNYHIRNVKDLDLWLMVKKYLNDENLQFLNKVLSSKPEDQYPTHPSFSGHIELVDRKAV